MVLSVFDSWALFLGLIVIVIGMALLVYFGGKRADARYEARFEAMRSHPSTGPHEVDDIWDTYDVDFPIVARPDVYRPDVYRPDVYDWATNGDFDAA